MLGYLVTALKERRLWLYALLLKYIRSKGLEPGCSALKRAERARGRTVKMVSLDGKIRVSASNPKDFLEQINRLLKD